MHAVIKIVSFLVLGSAVALGDERLLLTGALLILPLYLFGSKECLMSALCMLKRLRWLFLSIFVVYWFFTPGRLLIPDLLWGPTYEGLWQGGHRIGVLMVLVAAVNLLIGDTVREDFLPAVLWCLRPLTWLGLPHERLGVRITLTLEAVNTVRDAYRGGDRSPLAPAGKSPSRVETPRITAIVNAATCLFEKVSGDAKAAPLRDIALPEQSSPPLIQWLIPLILGILLVAVTY
jgi:energy-coupling factor transport system permease protein